MRARIAHLAATSRRITQERKKVLVAEEKEGEALAAKASLAIPILPKAPEDDLEAASVQFRHQKRTQCTDPLQRAYPRVPCPP